MARKRDGWRQEQIERKRQLAVDWDAAITLEPLLFRLDDATERQRRLFANGCCRRIIHLCREPWAIRVLEASEAIAEGTAHEPWLAQAVPPFDPEALEVSDEVIRFLTAPSLSLQELDEMIRWVRATVNTGAGLPMGTPNQNEEKAHATLLREILGNPFRPVAFSPEWRTDTALSLARQMYDSRDFGAIPILADALQDAGCDNKDVLNHCRDADASHVRGCWVVDLVLGKE